ncbi:MAG: DUF4367 domain-containing protein [Heliobacteriaceae bacterium]|nr:DUF4367 domain-containing protein [Heliobacteriaceae bacterium]
MKCPDQGTWQAYLDGEDTGTAALQLEQHARECSACQAVIEELAELDAWSSGRLEKYRSSIDRMVSEPHLMADKKANGGFSMKSGYKKWIAGVAAAAFLLAGSLNIPQVQQAAADFLSMFRVQKMQMVKISPEQIEQMAQAVKAKTGEVDLQQLGKVDVSQKQEEIKLSLSTAQEQLSFALKKPAFVPPGYNLIEPVTVNTEGKAEFRLEVDQVNSLLQGLGAQRLLPQSLQGQAFTVSMPAGVRLEYLREGERRGIGLSQFAGPQVTVPSGVDPVELRMALLDLPILPADLRTQLAAIEDWENTLVVPYTEDEAEQLMINGNNAVFSQGHHDTGSLLWVENGVVYQLDGVPDKETALQIAQSLR